MKHVQLVEDDDGIAELVEGSLAREGLGVDRFRDAESALLALTRSEPDAIVLDLGLPGLDGLEFCRVVRRTRRTTSPSLSACGSWWRGSARSCGGPSQRRRRCVGSEASPSTPPARRFLATGGRSISPRWSTASSRCSRRLLAACSPGTRSWIGSARPPMPDTSARSTATSRACAGRSGTIPGTLVSWRRSAAWATVSFAPRLNRRKCLYISRIPAREGRAGTNFR